MARYFAIGGEVFIGTIDAIGQVVTLAPLPKVSALNIQFMSKDMECELRLLLEPRYVFFFNYYRRRFSRN